MTGVVEGATGVAIEGRECGLACVWPAILTLALLVTYLALGLAMVIHFYFKLARIWKPEELPEDPDDVEDPLYRWISKFRKRILGRCVWARHIFGNHVVMTRDRGAFVRRDEDLLEPDRTERLLLNPFNIFPDRPSDAYDGLKINWLHRVSGDKLSHVMFNYLAYLTQLLIAAFAGIGPYVTPRSTVARAQVVVVLSLQFGFALWAKFGGAASDRVDGNICACQFFMEGLGTALLLAADFQEPGGDTQLKLHEQAFLIELVALFLPVVEKGYDAFIVQISICLRRKKGEQFSFSQAVFAMVGFLLQLPNLILSFLGITASLDSLEQVDEGLEAGETGIDDVVASIETDGLVDALSDAHATCSSASNIAQGISDAFSDAAYLQRIDGATRRDLFSTTSERNHADGSPADVSKSASCSGSSGMQQHGSPTGPTPLQRPGFSWLEQRADSVKLQ